MPFHKNFYYYLLIVVGIVIISWRGFNSYGKIKWIVLNHGSLRVNGSTNINNFSCIVSDNQPFDTLTCIINKDASVTMNGEISLDIFSFDCHNPLMTADLRKTLKAKEYPKMKIQFLSLNRYPEMKGTQEDINGLVKIELSGITKTYEVNYKFSLDDKKLLVLVGDRKVMFSDFYLIPPRKLGGIIRVNDELDVEFNLRIKVQ